jgi:hypothetical protein
MKYMFLMNAKKEDWEGFLTIPPDDLQAHMNFMRDLNEELEESGELVDAEGLSGPEQAMQVQAQTGAPAITDGPFPEAKEFLAGYWVLDCESRNRAIEIAARISGAPGEGGVPMNFPVEVRPIMSLPGEEM